MKKIIGIYGTTHLAITVAASFLKKKFKVIIFDRNFNSLKDIQNLKMPIYEPFVNEIFRSALKKKI